MLIPTRQKQWLKALFGPAARNRLPGGSSRESFRPYLDPLEDRYLPSTINVTNSADGCNPLVPNTFRWAIANASNGDTITFASNLSGQTISLAAACGTLTITKSLTITNPNPANVTINAGNQFTALALLYGTTGGQRVPINVTASGLSVTNGRGPYVPAPPAPVGGGGIYVSNYASLTLFQSNVSGNAVLGSQGNGGGIYNAGTLTLISSSVNGNSARFYGGAIDNDGTQGAGTLTVTANSVISSNHADGPPNTDSPLGGGIYNNAGTVTISNSALTGNEVSGLSVAGGAIYNIGYLSVTNSDLSSNTSYSNSGSNSLGGAIFNRGVATVTSSTLSRNQADGGFGFGNQGGAIFNYYSMRLALVACTLASNSVANNGGGGGGGAVSNDGILTADSSTFTNNYAFQGGGVFNDTRFSGTTITRSTFSGNFTLGDAGGGIFNIRAELSLQDDTFSDNTSAADGGAVYNGGSLSLFGTTLASNSATRTGGGLFNGGTLQAGNIIVAQNRAPSSPDISGTLGSQGHNLIGNGSGGSGYVGSDLVGTSANPIDPRLGPLQNNGGPTLTMALLPATCQLPASPAIEAGDNNLPHTATDQRGLPRISESVISVGAYEVQLGRLAGFTLCAPAGSTAGTPFNSVRVIPTDATGNTEVRYGSTVHFTSSDSRAILPGNYSFTITDRGVHTFDGFTLFRAGSQSITVADLSTGQNGSSAVAVAPAAAGTLAVSGFPSPVIAGSLGTFTITALDPYGNVATSYRARVTFGSTDRQAELPPDYTFASADNGVHVFASALFTAGTQAITAADIGAGFITGTQGGIMVNPAPVDHLTLTTSVSSTTAGQPFVTTLSAYDLYGNIATSYLGMVHFTSSDMQATLPTDYTFTAADAGVHHFGVTLRTSAAYGSGPQTMTAADSARNISGASTVLVSPAAAISLLVQGPDCGCATAGEHYAVVTYALDPYGNIDISYQGPPQLTSTDPQMDYTKDSTGGGVTDFSVRFRTAGLQTLTAADSATGLAGSTTITVMPAPAVAFQVIASANAVSGTPFDVSLIAVDPYGNTDTNYQGTVTWTTTDPDPSVQLPADYTFQPADAGTVTFPSGVTLFSQGDQTITATDIANGITGSTAVSVEPPGPRSGPGAGIGMNDSPSCCSVLGGRGSQRVEKQPVRLTAGDVERFFTASVGDGTSISWEGSSSGKSRAAQTTLEPLPEGDGMELWSA